MHKYNIYAFCVRLKAFFSLSLSSNHGRWRLCIALCSFPRNVVMSNRSAIWFLFFLFVWSIPADVVQRIHCILYERALFAEITAAAATGNSNGLMNKSHWYSMNTFACNCKCPFFIAYVRCCVVASMAYASERVRGGIR